MTLTFEQQTEVKNLIRNSLNTAESNWENHGVVMKALEHVQVFASDSAEPSKIPGNPYVRDVPTVEHFVALVVDMRNSTDHLFTKLSTAKISLFERVYHETSALLPAFAQVISYEGGSVTEYLGDGVLALFKTTESPTNEAKAAYRAAENCINFVRDYVNEELASRYQLPPVHLGAGVAFGPAMVTLVGHSGNKHPKALGRCIYEATKLSGAINKVVVSDLLHRNWKSEKGGTLGFSPTNIRGVDGFSVKRK